MRDEIRDWNKKVWLLNIAERKLEMYLESGKIQKKEGKKIKKIIDEAWIRVWDFHPNQHPLAKELFKLNFS